MPFLRTPSGWIWKDISKTATNKKNTAAKKNPFDVYEINKKPNPKCPRGQVYNIIEKRCKKYPVSLKNMTRKLRTGLSELDEKYYDDTTDEMFLRLVPEQMIRTGYKRTVGSHDVVLTPEFMQALDRHLSRAARVQKFLHETYEICSYGSEREARSRHSPDIQRIENGRLCARCASSSFDRPREEIRRF